MTAVAVLACGAEQSGTTPSETTQSGTTRSETTQSETTRSPEPALPLDADYLGRGQYARMHALLDKTILGIDVLEVEMRFGETTGRRLEELAAGAEYSDARADSVARTVAGARDVFIRVGFRRDVGADRFLEQIRRSLNSALAAGMLSRPHFRAVYDMLPAWFEFLGERGMKEGDRLLYRIRNDTVRAVFRARGGVNLLDQTDPTGAERRDALLAGYFAPASELREPLIRSLFDAEE